MNRRAFLRSVGVGFVAAVAAKTTFVFGNGVWRPGGDVLWDPGITNLEVLDTLIAQVDTPTHVLIGEKAYTELQRLAALRGIEFPTRAWAANGSPVWIGATD